MRETNENGESFYIILALPGTVYPGMCVWRLCVWSLLMSVFSGIGNVEQSSSFVA